MIKNHKKRTFTLISFCFLFWVTLSFSQELIAQDSVQNSAPVVRETRWLLFGIIGFVGAGITAYIMNKKKRK